MEPNCKPNYQSTMSYLHQLDGLIDADGFARIDYSRTKLGISGGAIDESNISDSALLGGAEVPAGLVHTHQRPASLADTV